MECSLSDFSVHGIFQARILEWAAFSYSRGLSQPRDQTLGISFIGRQIFLPLSHLESNIQGLPQPITTSAIILRLWSMKRLKLKNKKARLKLKKAGKTIRPIKVKVKSLSRVQLFATPWSVAYQASPSMGFSRQGYWSGLLFPPIR